MHKVEPQSVLFEMPGNLCLSATELAPLLNVTRRTLHRWQKAGIGPKPLPTDDYQWNVLWYPVHRVREWLSSGPAEAMSSPYRSEGERPIQQMSPRRTKGIRKKSLGPYLKMRLALLDLQIEETRLGLELSHYDGN